QLEARLIERRNLQSIASMSPVREVQGLSPHEMAALSILFADRADPEVVTPYYQLRDEMEKAGFTAIAVNLSLESLKRKRMVRHQDVEEQQKGYTYPGYALEPDGVEWIMQNQGY